MVQLFVALCFLVFSAVVGRAADIQLVPFKGLQIIVVSGEIAEGDAKTFANIAIPLDDATVMLDSPGGQVYTAIKIGRTIAIKGFSTAVGARATCASACGLIWLAGKQKYISSTARVGFHASYQIEGNDAETSGVGNALIGAYLRQIGMSDAAIVYMTNHSPASMQWMSAKDAEMLGIDVHVLPDQSAFGSDIEPAQPSQPLTSNSTAAAESGGTRAALGPQWKDLPNVDLPGHDLPNMPMKFGSAQRCENACTMTAGCQAYTYNSEYDACFLKSGVAEALQYTGAWSGYREDRLAAPVPIGSSVGRLQSFRTSEGVEILGQNVWDFRNKTLSWCQDQCVASQMCQGFTFYRGGRCVFKDHTKPTRRRADAVSGIKMQ